MSFADEMRAIEATLREAGVSRYALCKRAGIAHTTPVRLIDGTIESPRHITWDRIKRASEELLREAKAGAGASA